MLWVDSFTGRNFFGAGLCLLVCQRQHRKIGEVGLVTHAGSGRGGRVATPLWAGFYGNLVQGHHLKKPSLAMLFSRSAIPSLSFTIISLAALATPFKLMARVRAK